MYLKKLALKYQIKVIYGLEVNIVYHNEVYPLCLYAYNNQGYQDLIKISTLISCQKNVLNYLEIKELLVNLKIVFLSNNMPGIKYIYAKSSDFLNILNQLKQDFNNFYIGLLDSDQEIMKNSFDFIRKCANDCMLKTLAFDSVLYLQRDDYLVLKVCQAIKNNVLINDQNLKNNFNKHLKTLDELRKLFKPIDLENNNEFISDINVDLVLDKTSLPIYKTKHNLSSKDLLTKLCQIGLKKRLSNKLDYNYIQRLNYELSIIFKMNFEDYFLIVYDYVLYAKKKGFNVGPARGSSAASLVCFSIGITEIDPIKYNLFFERFLNPKRITMPDIDIDFPDDCRQEVIQYIIDKYGSNHCASIITFGTFKAKAAIRDVARVLGYKSNEVDIFSKSFDNKGDISLKESYQRFKSFRNLMDQHPKLYDLSLKIEGLTRHYSLHAAGLVLSKRPLNEIVPCLKVHDDIIATQYQMDSLENLGLIKMDILGLKNLTVIQEIINSIKIESPDFNINKIDLADQKTYQLLAKAHTLGIFQLESKGMTRLIECLKPQTLEEIAHCIALYRPGPMENIDQYLAQRRNPQNIHYLHQDLKSILQDTYGIIIFQEQIMLIAQKLAGFSLSEADILRKAMSKKDLNELLNLKNAFYQGMKNKGYTLEVTKAIYDLILEFANYGFNKAHSIAYALIAYQMSYLKANYPLYFYKAVLNNCISSSEKTNVYLLEAKNNLINFIDLNINTSAFTYEIVENSLTMPLLLIKNCGYNAVKIILELRSKHDFSDCLDTLCRLVNVLDKDVLLNLIYAGCFDSYGYNRTTLIRNLSTIIKFGKKITPDNILYKLNRPNIERYKEDLEVLKKEYEVLGFYYKSTPILDLKKALKIKTINIGTIKNYLGNILLFGKIEKFRTRFVVKNQRHMAYASLRDETGDINLIFFSDIYNQVSNQLKNGKYCIIEGKIEESLKVIVRKVKFVDENTNS